MLCTANGKQAGDGAGYPDSHGRVDSLYQRIRRQGLPADEYEFWADGTLGDRAYAKSAEAKAAQRTG